jgi:hypothetical protein
MMDLERDIKSEVARKLAQEITFLTFIEEDSSSNLG